MNQFFWNAYKRLEKEVLALSEDIYDAVQGLRFEAVLNKQQF